MRYIKKNYFKGVSFYLASTTGENALANERYYDLYVNLLENEITISKSAKGEIKS